MVTLLDSVTASVKLRGEGLQRTVADFGCITNQDSWQHEKHSCSGYRGGSPLQICTDACNGLVHIGKTEDFFN